MLFKTDEQNYQRDGLNLCVCVCVLAEQQEEHNEGTVGNIVVMGEVEWQCIKNRRD